MAAQSRIAKKQPPTVRRYLRARAHLPAKKWGVGPGRLFLILVTFAVGGSLCGWAGRKLLTAADLEKGILWWILYLLLITLLWPMCVLLISVITGQFSFFRTYLRKVARRMGFGRRSIAAKDLPVDENLR